jgi:hypothetical protein
MLSGLVDRIAECDDDTLTTRFRELELQRRSIEAEMACIVRAGERRALHTVDGHRSMKQWVTAQTNGPSAHAARLRKLARAFDVVPEMVDALSEGHIGVPHANELA